MQKETKIRSRCAAGGYTRHGTVRYCTALHCTACGKEEEEKKRAKKKEPGVWIVSGQDYAQKPPTRTRSSRKRRRSFLAWLAGWLAG
jgi:hypothetical protein